MKSLIATLLGAGCFLGSGSASANPRPLPFSYPYQTLPAESFEVEQYVDLIPVRVARELADGTLEGVTSLRSALQTEFEYGITDRLELGGYIVFQQGASAGTPFLRFAGLKQRLRLRLGQEGDWPVDVGLYVEVAEFHNEIELEQKVLLSRRFDSFTLVCNLSVEQEYYFQLDQWKLIYNPTLGAVYELSPSFMLGLEYWMRGRFDSDSAEANSGALSDAPSGTHHYVGPTVLLQSRDFWWSTGIYVRLDGIASSPEVDDPYGPMWFRTILGIGL